MGNTFMKQHTQRLHEAKAEVSTVPRLSSRHPVRQKGKRTQWDALLLQIREDRSQVGLFFSFPTSNPSTKSAAIQIHSELVPPRRVHHHHLPFCHRCLSTEFLQQLPEICLIPSCALMLYFHTAIKTILLNVNRIMSLCSESLDGFPCFSA